MTYLIYVQDNYRQHEHSNAHAIIDTLEQVEDKLHKSLTDFNSQDIAMLIDQASVNTAPVAISPQLDNYKVMGTRAQFRRIAYYLSDFLHFNELNTPQLISELHSTCEAKTKEIIMTKVKDTPLKEQFVQKFAPIFDVPIAERPDKNHIHFYTDEFIYHLAQWEAFTGTQLQQLPLQHITHFLKYLAWNMYSVSPIATATASHFDFLKAIECTHSYIGFLQSCNVELDKGAKYLYELEHLVHGRPLGKL